jgi:hypothetical protein
VATKITQTPFEHQQPTPTTNIKIMSDELQTTTQETTLAPSKYGTDDAFLDVASSGFLPRVQLMQSTSEQVATGKMRPGVYALVRSKDNAVDLTNEITVLVYSWRPKAIRMSDKDVKVYYNNKSAEFLQIRKDAEQPNSGCMYGPEFLIWVPTHKTFATLLMGSATARREASQLLPLVGKGALLRSTLIRGKRHNWQGPVITEYSQGFNPENLPSQDLLNTELNKFNDPPASATEKLENAPDDVRPQ